MSPGLFIRIEGTAEQQFIFAAALRQLAGAVAPHGDETKIFFSLPPPDPGSGRANERSGESDTSVPDSQYE